ncbi:hypothetical protein FA95DRAFT_1555961 [Auriscalpium vulgare]|uniref:Uncharacterized protein n=1 Tax=Auriscalpium vulgare TaxID=40419 RepID=A0ACB8S2M2_9AGAM|nr:hypothetical protein FA95DRAFT_1555961 [Auriscalpium vulgare]
MNAVDHTSLSNMYHTRGVREVTVNPLVEVFTTAHILLIPFYLPISSTANLSYTVDADATPSQPPPPPSQPPFHTRRRRARSTTIPHCPRCPQAPAAHRRLVLKANCSRSGARRSTACSPRRRPPAPPAAPIRYQPRVAHVPAPSPVGLLSLANSLAGSLSPGLQADNDAARGTLVWQVADLPGRGPGDRRVGAGAPAVNLHGPNLHCNSASCKTLTSTITVLNGMRLASPEAPDAPTCSMLHRKGVCPWPAHRFIRLTNDVMLL